MPMTLQDIFDQIEGTELRNLYIGSSSGGHIATSDYPTIINHINLGLIELYKKFPIKFRELTLQLYDYITLYDLITDRTESVGTLSPLYIIDGSLEPAYQFTGDILLITNVYNEVGDEFPLNDMNIETSIMTPEPNVIQMQYPASENTLSIIYRCMPQRIDNTTTLLTTSVPLPLQFLEAISAWIGYRHFAGKGVNPQSNPEAMFWYGQFLKAIGEIKQDGTFQAEMTFNLRFGDNGWV